MFIFIDDLSIELILLIELLLFNVDEDGNQSDTTEPRQETDTTHPSGEPGSDSGKSDDDSDKNLILYIAIPIASVVVIVVIIIIVLKCRKKRVTQSFIDADELGETVPD